MDKKRTIVFTLLFAALFTAVFAIGVSAAVEDELAADRGRECLFENSDFSNEETVKKDFGGNWVFRPGQGIDGSNAVEVLRDFAVVKNVAGLMPDTDYTYAAYFLTRELDGGDPPCIVIKGLGSMDDIYVPTFKELTYERAEFTFTTPSDVGDIVELHLWNVTAGTILVDSVYLFLYEPPPPPETTEPPAAEADTGAAAPEITDAPENTAGIPQEENSADGNNGVIIIIAVSAAAVAVAAVLIIASRKKAKQKT